MTRSPPSPCRTHTDSQTNAAAARTGGGWYWVGVADTACQETSERATTTAVLLYLACCSFCFAHKVYTRPTACVCVCWWRAVAATTMAARGEDCLGGRSWSVCLATACCFGALRNGKSAYLPGKKGHARTWASMFVHCIQVLDHSEVPQQQQQEEEQQQIQIRLTMRLCCRLSKAAAKINRADNWRTYLARGKIKRETRERR